MPIRQQYGSARCDLFGRLEQYQRLSMNAVLFPQSSNGLHPDELTIADMLKGADYKTACVGKWHLGHLPPLPAPLTKAE